MGKVLLVILALTVLAIILTYFKSPSKKMESFTPTEITTPSVPSTTQVPKMAVVAQNLDVPWALVFLPDGSIMITERKGTVRLVDKEGKLQSQPIATIQVKQTGESGLHGITIHPHFTKNKFIYLYYTYAGSGNQTLNRVSHFTFEGQNFKDEQIIVDQIPASVFHDGGRIKFGPDGYLYITTGDALNPSLAQDKNSLAGKILRVTEDGKAAPDNPFNSLAYSYGHRNPQGISWDPSGKLWETEHGQTATDEVNLIEAGKNYGWPTIRGDQGKDGMITPKLQSGQATWAPAGLAFYNGSLYFGGLRGQALFQLDINSLQLKEHFKGELGRIRDVVLGPDNLLYITTSNRDGRGNPSSDDDKIIRIDPKQL